MIDVKNVKKQAICKISGTIFLTLEQPEKTDS